MKITSTTTSTSLYDLIETANPWYFENQNYSSKMKHGNVWIEIAYIGDTVYVETMTDEATSDSRPISADLPIFAFVCEDLKNVFVYGSWSFSCSIV